MCYQYGTVNYGVLDNTVAVVPPGPSTFDIASVTDGTTAVGPVQAHIADKGALVPAVNGNCEDQTYVVKGNINEGTPSCGTGAGVAASAAGYNGCCGLSTNLVANTDYCAPGF